LIAEPNVGMMTHTVSTLAGVDRLLTLRSRRDAESLGWPKHSLFVGAVNWRRLAPDRRKRQDLVFCTDWHAEKSIENQ
jgi:hypothetical protein